MADQQVDLFLDQLVEAPIKDERALMEFPFFSLQKRPRKTPFIYDDGNVRIEIEPGAKGMATIWDKDILIYLASIVNERIESGKDVDRTIRFAAHDFMKVTGRQTGKRSYELFLDALHRLRSTNITTTIEAGGDRDRRGFGWIEDWRVIERTNAKGERVMAGVEVTLNRWMFNAVVMDRRVLTINRKYFGLTMGIERRLYELARKHVGSQPDWWVGLERLAEKCGTNRETRKFKADIRKIIERVNVPDYRIELVEQDKANTPFKTKDGQPLVHFINTKEQPAIDVKAVPRAPKREAFDPETAEGTPILMATIEAARDRFPGYSIEFLEQRWLEWTRGKGQRLKDPNKAFLAWCNTYTQNHPL